MIGVSKYRVYPPRTSTGSSGGPSVSLIKEDLSPQVLNGLTDLSLSHIPKNNKVLVHLNGVLLQEGPGSDYQYDQFNNKITILLSNLETLDIVTASYLKQD